MKTKFISHFTIIKRMKTGRPAFHIKAYWITIDLPTGSYFYKLDHRGNLERVNGQIEASRFVPATAADEGARAQPPTRRLQSRAAVSANASRPASVVDLPFDDGDLFGGFYQDWEDAGDFSFA
jgi:hypothetical protein